MKTNFKILALLFVAAFSSCSSDDSGDSNGTTTGNYFPMAVGNQWNYTNGSTTTQSRLIGTTTFGNTTYYESDDTGAELDIQNWVAKKGASYFQKAGDTTFNQSGTTIVMQGYELRILRDDIAVGESWTGSASPKVPYSGSGVSGSFKAKVNYEGTILAKDVSETLNGVVFNNIIKVGLHAVVNSNGQINTIDSEYWFAKDIGMIKEVETSTVDNITKTRTITSYSLN